METLQVEILAERKEEAVEALTKLVKRAQKAGNTDISWKEVGRGKRIYTIEDRESDKVRTYEVPTVILEITGEAPKYAGYTLLMRIEFAEAGALFHAAPGNQAPVEQRFYDASCKCEHCNKQRRRNDVYVVQHESGKQMQVGRNCLRDFLGIDDPRKVAARFSFWQALRDMQDEDARGGLKWVANQIDVLELAAAVIRCNGYASRRDVEEGKAIVRTSDLVQVQMSKRVPDYEILPTDKQLALETYNYFRAMQQADSDYERNLMVLFKHEAITNQRHLALVISAIPAYRRKIMDVAKRSANKERMEAVKDIQLEEGRQEIAGEVLTIKSVDTQFGLVKKMLVQREDGVRFYGSVPSSIEPIIGDKVKFAAKVQPKEPGFAYFSRPTKAEVLA